MNRAAPDRAWKADGNGWDDEPGSEASIAVLSGGELTLWSSACLGPDRRAEYRLRLTQDNPIVVGRNEGHAPDYLDDAYRPTVMVPGTGQCVLRSGGRGPDMYVSRGHFTLRAIAGGLLFVNGVPRRGGGLRPPLNGTWLIAPAGRQMDPGEEYVIESGTGIEVRLPNGSELRIHAD